MTIKPSPVYARLRRLLPHARAILAKHGLDSKEHAELSEYVPEPEPSDLTDVQMNQFIDFTESMFELGIAVGLLLDRSLLLDAQTTTPTASKPRERKGGAR
jgi:hypothetical protein